MELEVYETVPQVSDDENAVLTSENVSEIEDEVPDFREASNLALNAHFSQESVEEKIRRIRADIHSLKLLGLERESESLLDELKNAIAVKKSVKQVQNLDVQYSEKLEDFSNLESRVAKLESIIGSSYRSPSLKTSITRKLRLLEQQIQLVGETPNIETKQEIQLSSTESDKINYLYKNLTKYDEAIDMLPSLFSRLETLNIVHSAYLQREARLRQLEVEIGKMRLEVKEWRSVLEKFSSE